MNISLKAFTKLCADHIHQHEPILAYWHATGWGRLKLYPVMPEPSYVIFGTSSVTGRAVRGTAYSREQRDAVVRNMRRDGIRIGEIKEYPAGKPIKAKAATVKAMRKAIANMKKSRYTIVSLCSVDYDGQSMAAEGDETFVAAMQEAMGA